MDVRLEVIPEHPPLEMHERYTHKPNYPTTLAYLKVYLGEQDVADDVPSAYILAVLHNLLVGIEKLLKGHSVIAKWYSDPWRLEIYPAATSDHLLLTLQFPRYWVAFKDVEVFLDQFVEEVLKVARDWRKYLIASYPDEIYHPEKDEQFRRFEQNLKLAELVWSRHSKMCDDKGSDCGK